MSIYATLWTLKFPKFGDWHVGCEWIEVRAQGVPPHVGTPTPGLGYEEGDPFADFLPPPVVTDANGVAEHMRAVVIVAKNARKGTARSPQEYANPLLTLDGKEYSRVSFLELHERICNTLRGDRPAVVLEVVDSDGRTRVHFEDGTSQDVNADT